MSDKLRQFFVPVSLVMFALVLSGCEQNLVDRVTGFWQLSVCGAIIVILSIVALIELAGSPRSTRNKALWALLIIFVPPLGVILYFFLGR